MKFNWNHYPTPNIPLEHRKAGGFNAPPRG